MGLSGQLHGCQEIELYWEEGDEIDLGWELGLFIHIHEIQARMDDSKKQKNGDDDTVKEMCKWKMPYLPQELTWDEWGPWTSQHKKK